MQGKAETFSWKDGVYYTSEDGSLTYASKFSDIPTFVGNWTLEWEGW